ncbi:MAG: hypothetical protein HDT39_09210 [Lachnospiraceae bacterium]|nr:hypothetical protein [Lachnospiraceae bacterium]
MKKEKVYETGAVSTLHGMNAFFARIRVLFPEIDSFIGSHELINERICNNECYLINFDTKKTVVYMNTDAALPVSNGAMMV